MGIGAGLGIGLVGGAERVGCSDGCANGADQAGS
jgi:hypothetical protein